MNKDAKRLLDWEALKEDLLALAREITAILIGAYLGYIWSVIEVENYRYQIESALRQIAPPTVRRLLP